MNKVLYSLRTKISLSLIGVCIAHSAGSIFTSIGLGDGFGMLGNIFALISLSFLSGATVKYHDTYDMQYLPAVAMCFYLGSNLILLFGSSWTLAFMILPLIIMILQIVVFQEVGLLGIAAGILMILLNIIGGMIAFRSNAVGEFVSVATNGRIPSMYLAKLLVSNNSLMGIVCACLFCVFPPPPDGEVPVEGFTELPSNDSAFF